MKKTLPRKEEMEIFHAPRIFLYMKLLSAFLILTTFCTSANNMFSQSAKVSLNCHKKKISEVLTNIESQTEYLFYYNREAINAEKEIDIEVSNKSVSEVLRILFENQNVGYKLVDKHIVLSPNLDISKTNETNTVQQQIATVTGTVVDELDNPIIGASIVVEGIKGGSVTDVDGNFTIQPSPNSIIIISYVGYHTQRIVWNGQKTLSVKMKEDSKLLGEVVVVGFGTQKKENLTGAISVINSDDLASRPVANVTQALQGMVPGMNFSYGGQGAKVGSTMNINIRGTGTLDSNVANASPLVLIDGMEGDMNVLNMNDIESISILKDAAASSIYGSRAPYGVILITTKKGKGGRTVVNYNNSFRWSKGTNMPKMANSYDYAKFINQININDGATPSFDVDHLQRIQDYLSGKNPNTTSPAPETPTIWDWRGNANVDWVDEIFGGTGFSQEHAISVNGGTEKLQYYMSGNFLQQDGIVRYGDEDMKRYNFVAKINAQIAPWLKTNYSSRFTRRDLDQPYQLNDGLFYYNTMRRWPTQPILDPNGYYLTELPKQLMWGGNTKGQTDWFNQQLHFEIEPIKNWKTFVDLNYKTINSMSDDPRFKVTKWNVEGDVYYDAGEISSMNTYSDRTNFFNTNIYSEYTHQLNDHTFKGMLGFQSEKSDWKKIGAKKDNLISDHVNDIGVATGKEYLSSGRNHWATAGFFGRLNYNYAERYLIEVNLRYDGTSRFARNERWNLFPSFSAGWNIARESFMKPYEDIVNNFKLRGSWGELGNQNTVNLYPYIQTMPFYPASNTGQNSWLINGERQNGSTAPGLISSALTWETMRSWNIGVDMGFLRNRLTMSFDYFVRKTFDMVGPAPELPVILGTAVPKTNNADMQSAGFEIDIAWRDMVKDFSYGVRMLLSDDRQKVLKYPNESGSLSTWRKGQYLNEIWGLKTIGIAKSQEEMDAHLTTLPNGGQGALASTWLEGDIMYADINGDGKITKGNTIHDTGDQTIIGNSTPRFKFGLNLDAAWKGFDFRMFFQGVAKRDWAFGSGHLVYWGNSGSIWNSGMFENNYDFYRPTTDEWLGANQNAKFPRLSGSGKNRETQTAYLENAAYIRLKNIQLGYTIPNKLTNKWGVSNVRIFFSGENMFTITGLPDGIDPETLGVGSYGNGSGAYPLVRTYSTGVSVNF